MGAVNPVGREHAGGVTVTSSVATRPGLPGTSGYLQSDLGGQGTQAQRPRLLTQLHYFKFHDLRQIT